MNRIKSMIVLVLLATWAYGAPMVKIKCLGSDKYLHVEDSTIDYVYANKDGVGSWDVFYKEDLPSNRFALKCVATGTYVSAEATSPHRLYVGAATTPGNYEKFTLVWGGTNWAMQSVGTGYYVSGYTTGGLLKAAWSQIVGLYEQFCFTEVVDMYSAIKKWNDDYSSKYKLANTSVWPNYNTMKQMYIQDERSFSAGTFWIYEEFRDRSLGSVDPVWNYYGLRMIGDWEVLCCYETVPLACAGLYWAQGIPRCVRYLDFQGTTDTPSQTVNWYSIGAGCALSSIGSGPEYGKQKAATAVDLSNGSSQEDMGTRWVVDVGYKDDYEYWGVDIGEYDPCNPTTITVDPQYGIVYYYRFDGDSDNDSYTEFTNIQNKWGAYSNRCP